MRRREFITLLGGAAASPFAARAQQLKVFRLGYLEPGSPSDPVEANLRRQFLLGLRDLGYVEGRHFKMEDRSAVGNVTGMSALAADMASKRVELLKEVVPRAARVVVLRSSAARRWRGRSRRAASSSP